MTPKERKITLNSPVAENVTRLDPVRLQSALDDVHRAGMPGAYAEVRGAGEVWLGAAGVADLDTGCPVTPDMVQRVGSITKTFTAAAILRQVERGRIELDAPIGRYLPRRVPGERGERVTVRMLLNHTSGFVEYLPFAFPSLKAWPSMLDISPESLDDNRFRHFDRAELIEMGLAGSGGQEPGSTPGAYSNTNYLLLGELLEEVTGKTAEQHITRDVIERAGLRHTGFPAEPQLDGPHSRMYEALFGLIEPPRDYSVYDMSWVRTGAGMVSTVEDLNRFFRKLFAGEVVSPSSLAEMRRTVPVIAQTGERVDYGLGLHAVEIPGHGTFWGHYGTVWGALTMSLISPDGGRQLSIALNLARWNELDSAGKPKPHPIDDALAAFQRQALCGTENATR